MPFIVTHTQRPTCITVRPRFDMPFRARNSGEVARTRSAADSERLPQVRCCCNSYSISIQSRVCPLSKRFIGPCLIQFNRASGSSCCLILTIQSRWWISYDIQQCGTVMHGASLSILWLGSGCVGVAHSCAVLVFINIKCCHEACALHLLCSHDYRDVEEILLDSGLDFAPAHESRKGWAAPAPLQARSSGARTPYQRSSAPLTRNVFLQ